MERYKRQVIMTYMQQKRGALMRNSNVVSLDRYAGQWVVLTGEKVVGHSRSLPDAIQKATGKGISKKPTVFLVPRKDEGPYLLSSRHW